jgi:hypothetical protein
MLKIVSGFERMLAKEDATRKVWLLLKDLVGVTPGKVKLAHMGIGSSYARMFGEAHSL